jgi:hypothetical protein
MDGIISQLLELAMVILHHETRHISSLHKLRQISCFKDVILYITYVRKYNIHEHFDNS